MRIILVSTSYPISADGSEAAGAFVADFSTELAKQDDVCVVAPGDSDTLSEEDGVFVRRFAAPRLPLSLLSPVNPTHWPAITATLRRGRRAVIEITRNFEADHLFALWALPSGWWCRCASRQTGIPYSTWALGSDIWSLGRVPIVKGVLRTVLREGRYRFADGLQLATEVESLSGKDCHFLPSVRRLPVVQSDRKAAKPPYRLAFLGRWHPNKGIDLLLEALKQLGDDEWSKIEEVRIAGGGPLDVDVNSGCHDLINSGRPVSLRGFLDRDKATELLDWTDYLVIPSRIESVPVVFSDAMQCERPIICTPVGDLKHLVAKYCVGVVADSVTPHGIAKAIRSAIGTSPATFGVGLRRAQDTFSVHRSAAQFCRYLGLPAN